MQEEWSRGSTLSLLLLPPSYCNGIPTYITHPRSRRLQSRCYWTSSTSTICLRISRGVAAPTRRDATRRRYPFVVARLYFRLVFWCMCISHIVLQRNLTFCKESVCSVASRERYAWNHDVKVRKVKNSISSLKGTRAWELSSIDHESILIDESSMIVKGTFFEAASKRGQFEQ